MKLFKKIFGKNIKIPENRTITLFLYLSFFEDINHKRPELNNKNDYESFIEPVLIDVIKLHYYKEIKSKKWNYSFLLIVIPENAFTTGEYKGLNFRASKTNKIKNKGAYNEFCSILLDIARSDLFSRFPHYDREKIEKGLDNCWFYYYSSKSLLVASFLLEDIMKNISDVIEDTESIINRLKTV